MPQFTVEEVVTDKCEESSMIGKYKNTFKWGHYCTPRSGMHVGLKHVLFYVFTNESHACVN